MYQPPSRMFYPTPFIPPPPGMQYGDFNPRTGRFNLYPIVTDPNQPGAFILY
jgi:hypothetical protein